MHGYGKQTNANTSHTGRTNTNTNTNTSHTGRTNTITNSNTNDLPYDKSAFFTLMLSCTPLLIAD